MYAGAFRDGWLLPEHPLNLMDVALSRLRRLGASRLSLGVLHAVLVLQHFLLVSVTQRMDCFVPDVVKKDCMGTLKIEPER